MRDRTDETSWAPHLRRRTGCLGRWQKDSERLRAWRRQPIRASFFQQRRIRLCRHHGGGIRAAARPDSRFRLHRLIAASHRSTRGPSLDAHLTGRRRQQGDDRQDHAQQCSDEPSHLERTLSGTVGGAIFATTRSARTRWPGCERDGGGLQVRHLSATRNPFRIMRISLSTSAQPMPPEAPVKRAHLLDSLMSRCPAYFEKCSSEVVLRSTMMRRRSHKLPSILVAAVLSSCGGAPDEDAGSNEDRPVGFSVIYQRVFHNRENALLCTGCHDFLGAELSQEQLYKRLVGEPAQREPCKGEVRVVPGDPNASLLWKKLTPDLEVCGSKMPRSIPLFGPPPTSAQLELLKAWIEDGAMP